MREEIFSALFSLVSSVPGIITSSRRLAHWSNVPPSAQPALYQTQKSQTGERITGLPTKWTFQADLYLYVNNTDPDGPAVAMNNFLDAIQTALEPSGAEGIQNLGGLVHTCFISGPIETDEGTLGDQAVAIIPVTIITT
jgi:hypothetical protein